MASVTLAEMRAMVRQFANQETADPTSSFVKTTTEMDGRINEHLQQLRDLLIEVQGHEWAKKTKTYTLVANRAEYGLPSDFDETMGVRLERGGNQVLLDPWDYHELADLESTIASDVWSYRYRVIGGDLVVKPTPTVADTLHLDYLPGYSSLTAAGDKAFDMPHGAWRWAALGAAIDLSTKDRDDKHVGLLMARQAAMEGKLRKKASRRDRRAPRIRITSGGLPSLLRRKYPHMVSE